MGGSGKWLTREEVRGGGIGEFEKRIVREVSSGGLEGVGETLMKDWIGPKREYQYVPRPDKRARVDGLD
jgi:hypothetical protein